MLNVCSGFGDNDRKVNEDGITETLNFGTGTTVCQSQGGGIKTLNRLKLCVSVLQKKNAKIILFCYFCNNYDIIY